MPSYEELGQTEFGREMLKSQDRAENLPMNKHTNPIGEEIINSWNPYKLQNKFPFALTISNAFEKMIEKTIPNNMILSTRFQNWIIKEKNELMVDSKINRDNYFREQTDFKTGEVVKNNGANLVQKKIEYLLKELDKLEKSFTTHMQNNPDIAFASKEELNKWQQYYEKQLSNVMHNIEVGDFSAYDKKEGEIIVKSGTEEDALKHADNITGKIRQVDIANAELEARSEKVKTLNEKSENIPDYTQKRKQQ